MIIRIYDNNQPETFFFVEVMLFKRTYLSFNQHFNQTHRFVQQKKQLNTNSYRYISNLLPSYKSNLSSTNPINANNEFNSSYHHILKMNRLQKLSNQLKANLV